MIEMGKTYRTRDGREVRIYATDGETNEADGPIHGAFLSDGGGWLVTSWHRNGAWMSGEKDGKDLIPSDPHGILPRHRELLAEEVFAAYESCEADRRNILTLPIDELARCYQAALIALAKLDASRSNMEVGG